MKVKTLIENLQKCDPDRTVFIYNGLDEGGGSVFSAEETSKPFPYCKADPPQEYTDGMTYVLIFGEP